MRNKLWIIIGTLVLGASGCGDKASSPQPQADRAPEQPSNPSPANNAQGVRPDAMLTWQCIDPDGDSLGYDVYFGTASNYSNDPPLVRSDLRVNAFQPGNLMNDSSYCWMVVAKDGRGLERSGPLWRFAMHSPITQIVSFEPGGTNHFGYFRLRGHHVFISGQYSRLYGLTVLDVSEPAVPRLAGAFDLVNFLEGPFDLDESYVYLAHQDYWLTIIDFSNLSSPHAVVTFFPTGNTMRDLAIFGDYLYLAGQFRNSGDGLQILDVTNPSMPQFAGRFMRDSKHANSLEVRGSYAYLVDSLGLAIIDVSDPADPALAGEFPLPYSSSPYAMAFSGSIIYLSTYDQPLRVLDIANPASPILVGTLPLQAYSIAVEGDYGYGVTYENAEVLSVLDLSDPASPRVQAQSGPMFIGKILVANRYIYGIRQGGRLTILHFEP